MTPSGGVINREVDCAVNQLDRQIREVILRHAGSPRDCVEVLRLMVKKRGELQERWLDFVYESQEDL